MNAALETSSAVAAGKGVSEKNQPITTEFKPGDIAIFVLGGPPMLVVDDGPESGTVMCVWFDYGGANHQEVFPVGQLRPAPQ